MTTRTVYPAQRRDHAGDIAVYDGADPAALTLVHVSDTHNRTFAVPDGDVLVHTGDFSDGGSKDEATAFNAWLRTLPHPVKVVVPGNHDGRMENVEHAFAWKTLFDGVPGDCHLLVDTGVEVAGVKFFGQPWTHCASWGFFAPPDRLHEKWEQIPADTDVLLTHQPPYGTFDLAFDPKVRGPSPYAHWGCPALKHTVETRLTQCLLHCYGHVHDDVGTAVVATAAGRHVVYSNAAMDITAVCNVFTVLTDPAQRHEPSRPYPRDCAPAPAKDGPGWVRKPAPPPPQQPRAGGGPPPPPPGPPPLAGRPS
eukprot:TRINITY_DN5160_c0_g2_i1.p1 TRINITY_DN5160_c0_g2~~TRINITY_DN5160_c0_g2_i1.p1  ORF type:complete len:309 (+),score=83.74 TRINITY_DN5160_c0_g2_i1:49-975(+)